jgi:hypothetical protein
MNREPVTPPSGWEEHTGQAAYANSNNVQSAGENSVDSNS